MRTKEPSALLKKLAATLFKDEAEQVAFLQAMMDGDAKEQALIILKDRPEIQTFPTKWPLPWQPNFVRRTNERFKAGRHPLHEKGAFYSLDLSSVFSASLMLAVPEPPRRILDLCAAPGGKSIFAYRAFHPEILVCNETIRKRCGSLIGNLQRCGIETAKVWSADPAVYSSLTPEAFDLVIVDAPCSGQSLVAKGDPAPGAFTPHMIDMCVGRQRRITGNAVRCLRPGGHLLYATCTFSEKENERIIAWLLKEYPFLEAVEVPSMAEFQSRFAKFPCYRLFPHQGLGAGAFGCLLRHTGEPTAHWPPIDIKFHWWFGKPPPAPRIPVPEATDEIELDEEGQPIAKTPDEAGGESKQSKPGPGKRTSQARPDAAKRPYRKRMVEYRKKPRRGRR